MANSDFALVILAAGKATRFKSERSKLLHPLAGRPLGEYIVRTAFASGPSDVFIVVGHDTQAVTERLSRSGLIFVEQQPQLGTGHAVMMLRPQLEACEAANVVIVVGDAPLLRPETIKDLVSAHQKARAAATILSMEPPDPHSYGRIVRSRGSVRAIVEEKVATPAQRKIREVSSGILCFSRTALLKNIGKLSDNNAQKEFLLTDLVTILNRGGKKVTAFPLLDSSEALGVNNRVELAQMERVLRRRKSEALMMDGVTIADPATTYIDDEVEVGRDTVVEPGASLLGATRVGSGCTVGAYSILSNSTIADHVTVRPFCVITDCEIASGATIGPFAHLRDGTSIESGARIGNFVEVKKSRVGRGSKASHLTYLGDATIGEQVNVGAGTVTCNYDGQKKNPTKIGDGVFIGSGTMMVAPVEIGEGAYVAAGSTITEDVPAGSLGIGRARQVNKPGWAKRHKEESEGNKVEGKTQEPEVRNRK